MREVKDNGRVSDPGTLLPTWLITIAYLPTNAALYYGITMHPAVALFFGWVCGKSLPSKFEY